MDTKRANHTDHASSAKKRKPEFLSDDFIPFAENLPSSSNSDEDHRPNDLHHKSKKEKSNDRRIKRERRSDDRHSSSKDRPPSDSTIGMNMILGVVPRRKPNQVDRRLRYEVLNNFLIDKIGVANKNQRRKIRKKDMRLKNQVVAKRSTDELNSPARSSPASSLEFKFKPPILVGASPVSLVKNLKAVSPVKLNDVAAAKQTTVIDNSDRASTITLDDDDEEESPEHKRTSSFCQSEESIDLNDLRGIEGYNDFDKSDLKHDDQASSYSSYGTVIDDDSDEAECDTNFGCVSLNIDINKEKNFMTAKTETAGAGSIGLTNRKLPAAQPNYFNYSNPLYVDNRAIESNQSTEARPSSLANVELPPQTTSDIGSGQNGQNGQASSSLTNGHEAGWFVDLSTDCDPSNEVYPWIDKERPYSGGIIGLHEEIEAFHEYSRLKPAEIQVRNLLFLKVRDVVLAKWPNAQVLVFGSFQTGLSLPFADLDIVVINWIPKVPFYQLEHRLVNEGITTFNNVKVITKAAVPIIKFIHNQTGLSVDMSFNCDDGPRIIGKIKEYIQTYPALPKLLLVIKLLLHQRDLNFSYTGGLSSYSLTLMIVSFFQQHPRRNVSQDGSSNLGVLLLEFLELYGFTFDNRKYGIRVRNSEGYVRKNSMRCLNDHELTLNRLCVEDPMDETNNPSKNSHRWDDVRKAFRNSYNLLVRRCREPAEPGSNPNRKSILGELISYTPGEVEIRSKVLEFHSKELETIVKKKSRKTVCFDFSRDFIPFSVPDEPLGGMDYLQEELLNFR